MVDVSYKRNEIGIKFTKKKQTKTYRQKFEN